ncbi:hypothetical protein [Candidatus Scalindua japonica]|nr:hypothetical protein [Candidatus Scalindua japonica]
MVVEKEKEIETDYSCIPVPFPDKLANEWGQDEHGIFQLFTIN